MSPTMEPIAVSLSKAAGLLGVHPNTLAKMVSRGEIPTVRWGRRVLVPVEALKVHINAEAHRNAAAKRGVAS